MKGGNFLQAHQRPLTSAEGRLLRLRGTSLRKRARRAASAGLWVGGVVIAVLWALTMLASDAPALVITGFWIVVGGAIVLWVRRDLGADRRAMDGIAAGFESALRRNLADVYDIRASGFLEFEEIEDEGACYAFQLDGNRLVFIQGQELYDEAQFPSLDFSLVFPLDEAGGRVDMFIEKRGAKARPERRVPAEVKQQLAIPEDLQIVEGTLAGLEDRLRR
jgi:hypothetical protein